MAGDNSRFCRTSDTTMSRSRPRKLNSSILTIFSLPSPNNVRSFLIRFRLFDFFRLELCHEILDRKFFISTFISFSLSSMKNWWYFSHFCESNSQVKNFTFYIPFFPLFLSPSKIPNLFVSLSFDTCQNFEFSSFRQQRVPSINNNNESLY